MNQLDTVQQRTTRKLVILNTRRIIIPQEQPLRRGSLSSWIDPHLLSVLPLLWIMLIFKVQFRQILELCSKIVISDRFPPPPPPLFVPSNDTENSKRENNIWIFQIFPPRGQSSSNNSPVFATENKISVVVSPNSHVFLTFEEMILSDVFIFFQCTSRSSLKRREKMGTQHEMKVLLFL